MSYATYFTPLSEKVKGKSCKNASPEGRRSYCRFILLPSYPFTASNSAQISSSGLAVQRLTTTMTSAEITKAGSSS